MSKIGLLRTCIFGYPSASSMATLVPRLASGTEWLQAVDRLEWAAGMSATCFGVRVGVRVNDAALLPKLHRHMPPGWRISESPQVDYLYSMRSGGPVPGTRMRRFHLGFAGPSRFIRTLDESAALQAFEAAVQFDVAIAASRWLFIHAGVVGLNGQAVVIPAPSTHGKSRLVEALVRAGATYYSDEFAVIDETGLVHPFARPLALRDASAVTRRVDAADLGGSIGSTPLPVGLILSTRYEAGQAWRPRQATAAEGVMALLANTVRARIAPAEVLQTLAQAVKRAQTLEGVRGEAHDVSQQLLERTAIHSQTGRGPTPVRARKGSR